MPRILSILLLLTFLLTTPFSVSAASGQLSSGDDQAARRAAVAAALRWLHSQQATNGSIGGIGASCDVAWVAALAGEDPDGPAWTQQGVSLLDVCEAEAPTYLARRDVGRMAKVLRAATAAGANPRAFGGFDLIAELEARYNPTLGLYDGAFLFRQNLAALALHNAGRPLPTGLSSAVLRQQRPDGSWGWAVEPTPEDGFSAAGDLDTTARSLQLLRTVDLPFDHPAYALAVGYIRSPAAVRWRLGPERRSHQRQLHGPGHRRSPGRRVGPQRLASWRRWENAGGRAPQPARKQRRLHLSPRR